MAYELTPADLGILAAALDDALSQGLGDDGICDVIAFAITTNDIASEAEAFNIAHNFYRASL